MLEQPRLIKMLRNDSWASTTLGSLIFMVIGRKTHRANLKLTLTYDLHGVPCEKVFDQVITEQTKHPVDRAEVDLIIDQNNSSHILLKDAYA